MKIHRYIDPLRSEILAVYSVSKVTGAFTYIINPPYSNSKIGKLSGTMTDKGYVKIALPQYPGKRFAAHRLAWIVWYGPIPDDLEIDHINRCKCDNSYHNLRLVTRGENMRNKEVYAKSKSGVCGVSWSKQNKNWLAYITISGERKFLGCSPDLNAAKRLRMDAEKKFFTITPKARNNDSTRKARPLPGPRKHKKHICAPSQYVRKDIKFVNSYPTAEHVRKHFKITKTGEMFRLFGNKAKVTPCKLNVPDCGVGHTFMPNALAWIYWNGDKPYGPFIVVHVDGDKNNFSKANIKLKSCGVSFHASSKRWRAYIRHNRGVRHIGTFSTEREARRAYAKELKKLTRSVR